jgi:hypothetical protein
LFCDPYLLFLSSFIDNGSRGAVGGPKQRDIKAYFTTQNTAGNPKESNPVAKDHNANNMPVLSSASSDNVTVPLATTTSSSNSIFSTLQTTTPNTAVVESSSAVSKAVGGGNNTATPKSTKAAVGKENLSLSLKDPLINDLKKQFDQMKAAKESAELKVCLMTLGCDL